MILENINCNKIIPKYLFLMTKISPLQFAVVEIYTKIYFTVNGKPYCGISTYLARK